MSAGDIYSKTELGALELTQRKLKLAPRLRTMLILIDGRQPLLILEGEARKVGAPDDFIEQLARQGLVEKSGQVALTAAQAGTQEAPPIGAAQHDDDFARFRAAKDFMNASVVNAMGLKSFFFTLKLERAGTLDELAELVEPFRQALTKASGVEEAEVLTRRLTDMLA